MIRFCIRKHGCCPSAGLQERNWQELFSKARFSEERPVERSPLGQARAQKQEQPARHKAFSPAGHRGAGAQRRWRDGGRPIQGGAQRGARFPSTAARGSLHSSVSAWTQLRCSPCRRASGASASQRVGTDGRQRHVSSVLSDSYGGALGKGRSPDVGGVGPTDIDVYVVSEKAMAPHSSTLAWKIP